MMITWFIVILHLEKSIGIIGQIIQKSSDTILFIIKIERRWIIAYRIYRYFDTTNTGKYTVKRLVPGKNYLNSSRDIEPMFDFSGLQQKILVRISIFLMLLSMDH